MEPSSAERNSSEDKLDREFRRLTEDLEEQKRIQRVVADLLVAPGGRCGLRV
jgi:hypothetical protein